MENNRSFLDDVCRLKIFKGYSCSVPVRFREELGVFDEMELPQSTLEVVEPYLKKPHFNGDYLERKTNNPAVGSLLLWVKGVVR